MIFDIENWLFETSLLHQFSKFNNILLVCWFLGKNISNFIHLIQLGTISPFSQLWISSLLMAASKSHFDINDKMVQTRVNSEKGLASHLRLWRMPHLVSLNEIFRKCGYDTNKNIIFDAIYFHMKQWSRIGTF